MSAVFCVPAVQLDGIRLLGYTAWSLVDGFEWNYNYSVRRGLFYVDFTHPNRTRTPKTSAQYYRQVIADNGFPQVEPSSEVKGHFPCDFQWGIADSTLQVTEFRQNELKPMQPISSIFFLSLPC